MRYHFNLSDLPAVQADRLLSIESAMTDGLTRSALFDLKNLSVFSNRSPEQAKAFISERLGSYRMVKLTALEETLKMDLLDIHQTIRGVPVVLKARPVAS
ncbi:hypothetical protein NS2R_22010 [Pseudomonas oryzihabitans]|nr:hypothetical protein NS2R_22010 [Pseudomonas psychrotolerans]